MLQLLAANQKSALFLSLSVDQSGVALILEMKLHVIKMQLRAFLPTVNLSVGEYNVIRVILVQQSRLFSTSCELKMFTSKVWN